MGVSGNANRIRLLDMSCSADSLPLTERLTVCAAINDALLDACCLADHTGVVAKLMPHRKCEPAKQISSIRHCMTYVCIKTAQARAAPYSSAS